MGTRLDTVTHLVCSGREPNEEFPSREEHITTVHDPRLCHLHHLQAQLLHHCLHGNDLTSTRLMTYIIHNVIIE